MGTIADRLRKALPDLADFEDMIPRVVVDAPVTVISDLHIPLMDPDLFEQVIERSAEYGAKELFIVGDLYNMAKFSRHPVGLGTPQEIFREAGKVAHDVIDIAAEHFHKIHISSGNHDEWWIKHNEGNMGMWDLIRWTYPEGGTYDGGRGRVIKRGIPREILVYELPTVFATIQGAKWVFEHPGFYRRARTSTAVEVAEKYRRNAAVGHVHHWGMTTNRTGEHLALELGGLFDEAKFDYNRARPTNAPTMVPGFAVITGSVAIPFRGKVRKR